MYLKFGNYICIFIGFLIERRDSLFFVDFIQILRCFQSLAIQTKQFNTALCVENKQRNGPSLQWQLFSRQFRNVIAIF